VTDVIACLSSDSARWITGARVLVDVGLRLGEGEGPWVCPPRNPSGSDRKTFRTGRRLTSCFERANYTLGGRTFDALAFGYYDGQRLVYVARTRNGFTPSSREALFRKFKDLETTECPFVNLPEARSGRWGEGLTAEKMKERLAPAPPCRAV
jgi:ATP dependent DNA ligase C terminal region